MKKKAQIMDLTAISRAMARITHEIIERNQGVEHIRSVLLSLKENGVTILLASHFKDDIAYLCDEVYQMDCGILTRLQ